MRALTSEKMQRGLLACLSDDLYHAGSEKGIVSVSLDNAYLDSEKEIILGETC